MARKVNWLAALSLGAALLAPTLATAQGALPAGPVTMIVGWPAGGPSDAVARLVAAHMAKALGQSILIDNRAGAGGNIGSDLAAHARPDGSTIMLATATSHGLNSALYNRLNYDPIKDFAPIGLITTSPSVMLVPQDSPLHSVKELIGKARAQPGQMNYGSGGIGSSQHLAGAVFKKLAGVDVAHIPFKGTGPAMTDLMAGRVDFIITTGALPFIRSGKVRALAVAAHERLAALPEVPTFDEAGLKGFYTDSWYGLVAPAGTPKPALEALNAALAKSLRDPALQRQLTEQGSLVVQPMGLDAFWTFVKTQMPTAAEQVLISGAKAE
jgi:tripartite-type tricarboxylate transporter receptor subunit TctC